MAAVLWKELKMSPEEEKMAREIIENGAGKSLPEEKLHEFQVEWEREIEIDTRVGKIKVYLYWPKNQEGILPLLINMHGGGFIKGMRDQDFVFCRNICSRSGVAMADIDYVPAPLMRYPGQVYACYDILQYFAEHAQEFGIDRERIALAGHSAGGSLAAAIVLMAIENDAFVPKLQILDYPGLDLKTPAAQKRNAASNPRVPIWKSEFYNKMYVNPEDAGEIYCSPALASDEQLAKMPQTLMLYCENDTFCDEDAEFNRRLLELGVAVYGKRFLHSNHGFVVQRAGEYEVAESMILAALKSML